MHKKEQAIEKQSTKIKLPYNPEITKNLQLKLKEYKKRREDQKNNIQENQAPELLFHMLADTNYKIAVCESLLLNGEVDTHELSLELNKQDGQFETEAFNNACGAIEECIHSGGKEVSGSMVFGSGKNLADDKILEMKDNQALKDQIEIEKIREKINGSEKSSQELLVEKIEGLGDDQREMFNLKKQYSKSYEEFTSLMNEDKIDKETWHRSIVSISNAIEPLNQAFYKKVGKDKFYKLDKLMFEFFQTEIKTGIKEAKSFDELFTFLNKLNGIIGSQKIYSIKEIKELINSVRKGTLDITYITNAYGLKDKVEELLKGNGLGLDLPPNLPPELPLDAEWLTDKDMEELGVDFKKIHHYSINASEELRYRFGGYPEIGAYGLKTEFGQINGRLIWCDGEIAIFETPQGKIRMPFKKLVAPSGKTYEKIEEEWYEEEDRRRYEEKEDEDRRRFNKPKARYMEQ